MKLVIASFVFATVGLGASSANAWSGEDLSAPAPAATDAVATKDADPAAGRVDTACAKARAEGRICQIDIDGITVDGDRPGGDGTMIAAAMWASHGSLIRLRRDFIDAIVQAAEDIE